MIRPCSPDTLLVISFDRTVSHVRQYRGSGNNMAAEVKGEDMLGELDGNVTRGERFHTRKCCKRLETFWSCLLFITPYSFGIVSYFSLLLCSVHVVLLQPTSSLSLLHESFT